MEQRVSLITLAVDDMEIAAGFYEALGWKRVETQDGVIAFDLLGQVLGLYPKTGMASEMGMDPSEITGFSGITLGHNVRSKMEVDDLIARAEAAGGRIIKPAQDVFWGGYHGFFADLDGHVWEAAFNPFSNLGPKGEFQWNGVQAEDI